MKVLVTVLFALCVALVAAAGLAGGWHQVPEEEFAQEHVKQVLAFSGETLRSELGDEVVATKIVSVERQVVAGLNWRITLDLTKACGEHETQVITIYQNLQGEYQVTSRVTL